MFYLFTAVLSIVIGGIILLITTWYMVENGKYITVRVLKWIVMAFEGAFSMPIFGHLMYVLFSFIFVPIMLGIHVVLYFLSKKVNEPYYPHKIGMITAATAFVPVIGWVSHVMTVNAIMYGADSREELTNPKKQGMRGRGLIIPRKYKNAGKNLSTPQKTKDNEV